MTPRPAMVVAAFYGAVVLSLLATHAWDPRFFATVGPQWARHDPAMQKQADGSIFLDYAIDPLAASRRHDRMRTGRIMYPLAAHVLALGRPELAAWALVLIDLVAIVLGTELAQRLLERRGLPPWTALAYGAWGGSGLALLHATCEPVAYLFILAGIEAQERGRGALGGAAFLCALLTRETTALLAAPYLLARGRGTGRNRWLVAIAVAGAWGVWLCILTRLTSGSFLPGGGLPALPLSGYLGTRALDLPATVVYLVVPSLAVIVWAATGLRRRPLDASLWAALLNALLVAWLPASTVALLWHGGRLATGLVTATLLASPLAASAPRLWRGLMVLFITSASWTAAVTLRYLIWDTVSW